MKEKSIEYSIVNSTKLTLNFIPLDVLLVKGNYILPDADKPDPRQKLLPIKIKSLNFEGDKEKHPIPQ